jgi:hypothetical protein
MVEVVERKNGKWVWNMIKQWRWRLSRGMIECGIHSKQQASPMLLETQWYGRLMGGSSIGRCWCRIGVVVAAVVVVVRCD